MTPMEKAIAEYERLIVRNYGRVAVEAAVTAYLAALPEDKETVNKVREAILHAERFGRDRAEGALRALTGTGR